MLGLAFKPNIDDLRESPAVKIAEDMLQRSDINLLLVEPNIKCLPSILSKGDLVHIDDISKDIDCIFILVKHRDFNAINFNNIISFV